MSHIFLSWSKPESKEIANCLKKFLNKALEIRNQKVIFISSQNISGDDGWYRDIRINASSALIIIPCLTLNSLYSPWIHFETGMGSSLIEDRPKKIIPFLFDLSPKQLDSNMGMMSFHQMVYSEEQSTTLKYRIMLMELLYSIDDYLCSHHDEIAFIFKDVAFPRRYESKEEQRIYDEHTQEINDAIDELITINEKYSSSNFYISRPMRGIRQRTAMTYQNMISHWESIYSQFRFYYSKIESGIEEGFSYSRMDILKKSQYFVLIYPKSQDLSFGPSSSLVELGGSIAFGKRIIMFIERGSVVPSIIKDLKLLGHEYYIYTSIIDLEKKWNKFVSSLSKNHK